MNSDQSIFKNRLVRIALVLFVPVAILGYLVSVVGPVVYNQYTLEQKLKETHGDRWQEHYESTNGPLVESRTKAAVGLGSMIIVGGLAFGIYRITAPQVSGSRGSRKRRRSSGNSPRRDRRVMPPARRTYIMPQ